MSKHTIWTQLKNTDLHAMSAKEAITSLLGVSNLRSLKRYTMWEVELESPENAEEKLQSILKSTYYLANPNKEESLIDQDPSSTPKDGIYKCLVKVSPKHNPNRTQVIDKIAQKCGVTITTLQRFIVWEVHVDRGSSSPEEVRKSTIDNIIETTSYKKGLLVNPIQEDYVITD